MTVLFMIYPTLSHFYSVLGLANAMQNSGYRVVFLGAVNNSINKIVIEHGFEVIVADSIPFALSYSDELKNYKTQKKGKKELILDRLNNSNLHDRVNVLGEVVQKIKPTIILLDSFTGGDFLCLYPFVIHKPVKIALINTMIEQSGFDSEIIDSMKISNVFKRIRIRYKRFLEYLFCFGNTTSKLLALAIKEMEVPSKFKVICNLPLSISFENVKEFVIAPSEFDFPVAKPRGDRHYIGFLTHVKRRIKVDDADFKKLQEIMNGEGGKIYISFGTLSFEHLKRLDKFFKAVDFAAKHFTDYNFIITCAKNFGRPVFSFGSKNIHVFGFQPQTYILSKSAVFITHGGLNSIKEAILYNVPLIVYPLNRNYDQYGNASRVTFHKLGLQGDLKDAGGKRLIREIKEVLNNGSYRGNISKMSSIDSEYSLKRFVMGLEAIEVLK
ncbi:glycosyltransferase [Fulvivirgaceae bacterium PWU4]|uniref:Glycosyltransferase n=1 Tax=Chryseosolibacter histidini TaxID=2782349 RepID=A0AAP2DMN5_9BACT|nr:glycosyltransferase [Chryseosolibacter histidini]MBT1699140.1 glycosyltransferase [Chryseosolibacter histidini]